MGKIFGDSKVLKNESQAAVEIRNHSELKTGPQLLEHFRHFGVKLPDTCFGEVFVRYFEKIVPVKFAQLRRNLIEYVTDQLAPPAFVVIFARTVDCSASRHLLPGCVKCAF